MARNGLGLWFALFATGCGAEAARVRVEAARRYGCPESAVEVRGVGDHAYGVSACGYADAYVCKPDGSCETVVRRCGGTRRLLRRLPRARAEDEAKAGRLLDALRLASEALRNELDSGADRDPEEVRALQRVITDLLNRVPHVTFKLPADRDLEALTFDHRSVPIVAGHTGRRFSVDPGEHLVRAAARGQREMSCQRIRVSEGAAVEVVVDPSATECPAP